MPRSTVEDNDEANKVVARMQQRATSSSSTPASSSVNSAGVAPLSAEAGGAPIATPPAGVGQPTRVGQGRPHSGAALPPRHPRDVQQIFSSLEEHHAASQAALVRALQVSESTNETSDETLSELHRQRETMHRTIRSSDATTDNLHLSQRILRDVKCHATKERLIKVGIVAALWMILLTIVYFKFLRKA